MKNHTLYVRGVPEDVARRAKAAAAREGMTLTAFVVRAIDQAAGGAGRHMGELSIRDDMQWFEANSGELMSRYAGEYIAIVGADVVDHDAKFGPLATRVFERFGVRPVYMPKCVANQVAKLRSPRVKRT